MPRTGKSRSIELLVLTDEQLALQARLEEAERAIEEAKDSYRRLRKTCKHVMGPLTDALRKGLREHTAWKLGGIDRAYCEVCSKDLGWRCPDSPDTVCHYYTKDAKVGLVVELIDGTEVLYTTEGHHPDYETDDSCLFCGSPEERK